MPDIDRDKLIEHLDAHIALPTGGLSYAEDAMKAGKRHALESLRDHVLDGVFDLDGADSAQIQEETLRKAIQYAIDHRWASYGITHIEDAMRSSGHEAVDRAPKAMDFTKVPGGWPSEVRVTDEVELVEVAVMKDGSWSPAIRLTPVQDKPCCGLDDPCRCAAGEPKTMEERLPANDVHSALPDDGHDHVDDYPDHIHAIVDQDEPEGFQSRQTVKETAGYLPTFVVPQGALDELNDKHSELTSDEMESLQEQYPEDMSPY